jgi:hypothetical protein
MNNQDEQEPTIPPTFPADTMNEMNDSFEDDLVELVNFNNNSNSIMNGPTLKNKKKKAKASSPVAKNKKFAKHDEYLKDRPTRSLSAYNIFFAAERKKLLADTPVRATGKPRKSHGKVGFSEMAKIVGAKWKNINPQDKLYYEGLAAKDKWRYNVAMGEWTMNRLEARVADAQAEQQQQAVDAAAAQAAAAAVRPVQEGMTPFQPQGQKYGDRGQQQQEHYNYYSSTTASIPVRIIEPNILQGEGNASEAEARDYLRRLQLASFSSRDAPTAVAVDVADNTNLSNAQKQSYEARNNTATITTTAVSMYNLSSSRSTNNHNYNNNLDNLNLNNNNYFDPIPLADAQSCHPQTLTSSSYDNNHTEYFQPLTLNMDEDCVNLLVDMFRPSNQQAARARRRQQQQQHFHNTHHHQASSF